MKGQVALETLMVLAAVSGVLFLLMDNYADLFDVLMDGLDKKKVEYAASIIRDAGRGCTDSTITVELPYDVAMSCSPAAEIKIGEHGEELEGMRCNNEGKGRRVKVSNCVVEIT